MRMPTLYERRMYALHARNAEKRTAEMLIYEPIGGDGWGGGLTAKAFKDNLDSFGDLDEIDVRINSPGGEVSEGVAIYNTLVNHPAKINVFIDGIAASAASFVAQAASPGRLSMAENALFMIHNASGMTWGRPSRSLPDRRCAEAVRQIDRHDVRAA